MATAERLLGCLENPFAVGGHTVRVTASIGVAVADGSKSDPESLLRDADHAVIQAKRDGRERAVLFSSSMRPRTTAGGAEQLRVALADEQFRLVYQPVVSSFDGSIVGVEALLRWDHPSLGLVMPSEFIPQLEETGLIVEVGSLGAPRVMPSGIGVDRRVSWSGVAHHRQRVCPPAGRAGLPLDRWRQRSQRPGCARQVLCLELTEGTMLLDTVAAWARLREVKLLGVRTRARRLRHRVLVAQLRASVRGRHDQDRPFLRARGDDECGGSRHRRRGRGHGERPRPRLRRRGCRDEGAGARAACPRMWPAAGPPRRALPRRPSTSPPCSPPRASSTEPSSADCAGRALSGQTSAMRTRVTELLGIELPDRAGADGLDRPGAARVGGVQRRRPRASSRRRRASSTRCGTRSARCATSPTSRSA